jgi:hypothetical protein
MLVLFDVNPLVVSLRGSSVSNVASLALGVFIPAKSYIKLETAKVTYVIFRSFIALAIGR